MLINLMDFSQYANRKYYQITKTRKLFGYKLKEELNSNNTLYKLRELINWSGLEEWLSKNVSIKRFGRNRKCHRVILGVTMLQAMYNFSDSLARGRTKRKHVLAIFLWVGIYRNRYRDVGNYHKKIS